MWPNVSRGAFEFAGEQRALEHGLLDHALDIAGVGGLTELGALIEHFEHAPRLLAGLLRAANHDLVAVGVGDHAEAALDERDVLVVMAEHDARRGGCRGRRISLDGASRLSLSRRACFVNVVSVLFKFPASRFSISGLRLMPKSEPRPPPHCLFPPQPKPCS